MTLAGLGQVGIITSPSWCSPRRPSRSCCGTSTTRTSTPSSTTSARWRSMPPWTTSAGASSEGRTAGSSHRRHLRRPGRKPPPRSACAAPPRQQRRAPYLDYLHRTMPLIERGKQSGSWWWPSPSAMFFVPDSDARAFVTDALADPVHLEGTELFEGFAFLAAPNAALQATAAPLPRSAPLAFQAWIFRRAPRRSACRLLDPNLKLWERVKSKGGEPIRGLRRGAVHPRALGPTLRPGRVGALGGGEEGPRPEVSLTWPWNVLAPSIRRAVCSPAARRAYTGPPFSIPTAGGVA